jgi:hypothetical protein
VVHVHTHAPIAIGGRGAWLRDVCRVSWLERLAFTASPREGLSQKTQRKERAGVEWASNSSQAALDGDMHDAPPRGLEHRRCQGDGGARRRRRASTSASAMHSAFTHHPQYTGWPGACSCGS